MEAIIMKLNDMGIITLMVLVILVGAASAIHKHKDKCVDPEACEIIEDMAEAGADAILHLPAGSTDKIIAGIE